MTSHRWLLPVLGAVIGSSLSVVAAAPSAYAAPDPSSALGLPSGVTATVAGSGVVSNRAFNDFPSQGSDYYVISTGLAGAVLPVSPDPDGQLSSDFGNDGAPDSSSITLTVASSTGAGCLFVDFALGTEEPVHTYTENVPGDRLTITKDGTDYAKNVGRGYFQQAGWLAQPKPYMVNAIDYWHHPGDPLDPAPGTAEEPWLPEATALNSVTTRDTARIPLDFAEGDEVIEIKVADVNNGDLDTAALLDDIRLGSTCAAGSGVEPNPVHDGGVIAGIRGVGNALVYDPIPSTDSIERYDDPGNGWRSPSGVPVELRFRWYRTQPQYALNGNMSYWHPIPDADRQVYVPTAGDKGLVLIVLVTGVVDGRRYETFPSTGEASTWYSTTPIANGTFVEGEAPIITGPSDGTAAAGDVLTAQIGHTVPREDTWTWRWYADGLQISGATGQSLTLSAAQAGKTITVQATARRLNFDEKPWLSAPYGPIELQQWTSTGIPSIVASGVPEFGKTLEVNPGAWTPVPDRYSYQWKRDGNVISGATYANYTVRADDVGSDISVVVTGSKPGYLPVPKESPAVEILGATMDGATPTVTGTPKVGERLVGSATDWDPNGSTLTYAWYAGETLLQEGSNFLVVPASAVGQPIVLKVTGRKAGYLPLTLSSAPTATITRGTLIVGSPSIRGFAQVGQTLIASPGFWAPSGVKISYRWKIGKNRVTGRKGSRSTFVVPRIARGKRISVIVTGRLVGYDTAKRTSPPTAKVIR